MKLKILSISAFLMAAVLAGCDSARRELALEDRIAELTRQKEDLSENIAILKQENEQLQKQIETLAAVSDQAGPADIYQLSSAKLTRYTNIYDRDEDGKPESLLVYLQPLDRFGDVIKAGGSAHIELWDLSKPDNALLKEWQIESAQLKKNWFDTFLGSNYRLKFDVSDVVADYDHPLTVKARFTSYLSGQIFQDQIVIKP